jgi:hypothetical protein
VKGTVASPIGQNLNRVFSRLAHRGQSQEVDTVSEEYRSSGKPGDSESQPASGDAPAESTPRAEEAEAAETSDEDKGGEVTETIESRIEEAKEKARELLQDKDKD